MVWVLHGDEPEFCPRCGDRLGTRDTEDGPRPHCADCGVTLYANAAVMARAVVVDGNEHCSSSAAWVPTSARGRPPGGHVDAGETAREAAVRELEEETGLSADPGSLRFVNEGYLDFGRDRTYVSFNYAVPYARTTGAVDAGSDAADARWWTRDELETDLPAGKNNLRAIGADALLDVLADS